MCNLHKALKAAGVCHIPHCLSSGDISTDQYHTTKTCGYVQVPWACYLNAPFIPHWHYHLTLDVIGHSLTTFQSSYEMTSVVHDAIIGKLP
ncbi:hypothetical protein L208DRAFT_1316018 [Tricholoma matsutake]|nr:hypothetical protein L208DRAFT_1316018 [Tricholoma matsutake 945]